MPLIVNGMLLGLILVMRVYPEIPFSRMLHIHLVEIPLVWLGKRRRHDFLYIVILIALSAAGGEVALMLGPEFVLMYAADLAIYLDALAATYLIAAYSGAKVAARSARTRLSHWSGRLASIFRARPRERATGKQPRRGPAGNDDEDSRPFRLAA